MTEGNPRGTNGNQTYLSTRLVERRSFAARAGSLPLYLFNHAFMSVVAAAWSSMRPAAPKAHAFSADMHADDVNPQGKTSEQ
ncbi:MAG: hypothetical protein AB7T07_04710 [Steroidobacteraceae bacterium]